MLGAGGPAEPETPRRGAIIAALTVEREPARGGRSVFRLACPSLPTMRSIAFEENADRAYAALSNSKVPPPLLAPADEVIE
jgi:hypothetical protein